MTAKTPRTVVLAEVEFMLGFGERPNRIAEALGLKPGSVARSLLRSGRPDLACVFEQARPERNRQCADCGTRITGAHAKRCRHCGCAHREASKRERVAA